MENSQGYERVTIQEAARRLGISEGAVRKRVTRGTLEHEKEPDGRVYVWLRPDERTTRGVDTGQDGGVDPNNTVLISRLEDEVAFLRDQVRRQQEIIAQQAITMRQLSAGGATEPPAEAETVEQGEEPPTSEATGGSETAAVQPWWKFWS